MPPPGLANAREQAINWQIMFLGSMAVAMERGLEVLDEEDITLERFSDVYSEAMFDEMKRRQTQ
jgi:hypothetical protein